MSKVINLKQVRKQHERADKRAAGDVNAAKFGETKAAKDARKAEEIRAARVLDGHRGDDD